jgi:hypothetical protein
MIRIFMIFSPPPRLPVNLSPLPSPRDPCGIHLDRQTPTQENGGAPRADGTIGRAGAPLRGDAAPENHRRRTHA